MDKQRILWLDYARAIIICSVVLVHTPIPKGLEVVLYYLQMPFFFFCSGFLFSFGDRPDFLSFVRRKAKRLMLPYLLVHFVSYFFWLFFDRNYGNDVAFNYPFYEPLPDILLGRFAIDNLPLWFLPALFTTEVLFFLLFRSGHHFWLKLVGMVSVGFLVYTWVDYPTPMMLATATTAILFFGVGYGCKIHQDRLRKIRGVTIPLIVFFTLLFYVLGVVYNGKIAMHKQEYNHYFFFLLSSLSAIILASLGSILLSRKLGSKEWVRYVSENTIVILLFHIPLGKLLKAVTIYVFHQPLSIYENAVGLNLLFSLISVLLLIPVSLFLNRYCPWVIGKDSSSAR